MNMTLDGQKKVLRAGFTIIRPDNQPQPRIKTLRPTGEFGNLNWVTLEKFDTKAARDRRFRELLENPDILED